MDKLRAIKIKGRFSKDATQLLGLLLFASMVFLLIFGSFVKASQQDGKIKIFPVSYNGEGWQNSEAGLIQDLDEKAEFAQFSQENSAFIIPLGSEISAPPILELFDFGTGDKFSHTNIENAQLRVSLAGQGGSRGGELSIEYMDNTRWKNLDTIILNQEISNNINGGYRLYSLPVFASWDDLKDLRVRFVYRGIKSEVYLDALWLEVDFDDRKTDAEQIIRGTSPKLIQKSDSEKMAVKLINKKSFRSDEEPIFELYKADTKQTAELHKKITTRIKSVFQKEFKIKQSYLIGPGNEEGIAADLFLEQDEAGNYIVKIKKPPRLRPGKYFIKLEIEKLGQIYDLEQEFTWGVLAINVNKSIYSLDETAYLQMAVLRDDGHTICDASLKLQITNPKFQTTILSTEDGTIKYSGVCSGNNVVNVPDYFAYYPVRDLGIYQMKLINLDNGYEITDSFEAHKFVPFDIERIGPTRIYPLALYEMKMRIKANQDFQGKVKETVPTGFEIARGIEALIIEQADVNYIIWQVDWKAGQVYELKYTFDAPDKSPYLYLLGPLESVPPGSDLAGSDTSDILFAQPLFQEARQWQIASDAPDTVTLRPDAAGYYTEFETFFGAATHYETVDEETADDDDSYILSDVLGERDTFNLSASGLSAGTTINSVTVYARTKREGAPDNDFYIMIRSDTTDALSGSIALTTDYVEYSYEWTQDPATTAAWTVAGVDALQAGAKIDTGAIITQVWAVVEYTIPDVDQAHYRWRDDDGSESAATWLANMDTAYSGQDKSDNIRLRFEIDNKGSASASSYDYRLEYASTGSNCSSDPGGWTTVPVTPSASEHFEMTTSANFADSDPTTNQLAEYYAIRNNPTVDPDYARAIDSDGTYVYVFGHQGDDSTTDIDWRIEKRDITDGSLVTAFGSPNGYVVSGPTSRNYLEDGLVDGDYIYAAGRDYTSDDYRWRIEKRNKTNGNLCTSSNCAEGDWGDSDSGVIQSNPSTGIETVYAIAIDSTYLYVAGHDNSQTNDQFRIEKYNKATGDICDSVGDCAAGVFGTAGVFTDNYSSGTDKIYAIDIDSSYIYVGGYGWSGTSMLFLIEKIDIADGTLVTAFGGDGRVQSDPDASYGDDLYALTVDGTYLYVGGMGALGNGNDGEWRLEKYNKTTGNICDSVGDCAAGAFDTDGAVTVNLGTSFNQIEKLAVDSSYIYAVGNEVAGDLAGRIEKRDIADGSYITAFGSSGAIQVPAGGDDGTSGNFKDIVLGSPYFYIAGYDNGYTSDTGSWRNSKRNIVTGFTGTFTAGEMVEDSSNSTGAFTLANDYFSEHEYNFQATTDATDSGTYCFRLTNAGTALDTYTRWAELTLSSGALFTLNQRSYRWQDDDGANVNSNTNSAAADTSLTMEQGERATIRIQLDNTGTADATSKVYKLQFKTLGAGCGAAESWTDAGAATAISYSSGLAGTNGDSITAEVTDVTNECGDGTCTGFVNGTWHEDTNLTTSQTLTQNYNTEFGFMIETSNAASAGNYCLRLYNNTDNEVLSGTYVSYPALTIVTSPDKNYSKEAAGSLPSATTDLTYYLDDLGYTYVGTDDNTNRDPITSSANIPISMFKVKNANNTDDISITWNGQSTVAPSTNTVTLEIYNGTSWESVATDSATGADTDFTLSGSKSGTGYYDGSYWVYVRVYQASGTQTLKTDYISVTFTAPSPTVTQKHFKWRNDDGGE